MRKFLTLLLYILPMLLLSQDSTAVREPWISLDTVVIKYSKIPMIDSYEFAATATSRMTIPKINRKNNPKSISPR